MAENIDSQENQPTLGEQINTALANVDDSGKLQFDEDVNPMFKTLVITEQKARTHQASYTKSRQEVAGLKAKNGVLEGQIAAGTTLTNEQVAELDDLKHTDPDAWFKKKTEYETMNTTKRVGELKELTDAASTKALNDLTLDERKDSLLDFQTRTGIILTDDIMKNDVPLRLQSQIDKLPFGEYLDKVATYLKKDKVIKQTDDGVDQVNLGDLAGGGDTKETPSTKYQIL